MSTFRNYLNMYEFETVLPGSEDTIVFRPITTGQIKRLLLYETSNDPSSIEDALDQMMNECIIKPEGFDVTKLYLQDRFYLLVELRKATRGATYNFQTTCASCGSQTQQILNLSQLVVTKLKKHADLAVVEKKKPVAKKAKLVEKSEVLPIPEPTELPSGWDVVKLNNYISLRLTLVTREMQREAITVFEKNNKGKVVTDIARTIGLTTILYALSIKSIITPEGEDSEVPLDEKMFLLDNIQQGEQDKIAAWYEKNDFGIDFSFDVECSHCRFTEKKAVPVDNFFY